MPSATCHTPECGNAEIPIEVTLWVDIGDGYLIRVGGVTCGACGVEISDLDESDSEEEPSPNPEELPDE